MNEPLRPSSLGEILDRTVQLYRSRFLLYLGISLIPTGVLVALACAAGLVVAWWSAAGAHSVSSQTGYVLVVLFAIAVALVALPLFLAATALATAAMNHAVSRVHLGETTTIRSAYKSVWRLGWRYIWLYLLEAFLIGVAPLAAWVALVFSAAFVSVWAKKNGMGAEADVLLAVLAVVFVVALLGYFVWMLLRLSLAFPACVVEQLRAWASLKRSSLLTKGTKGRIFLLYLLVAALGWLLSMGVSIPLMILLFLIPGMSGAQHQQTAGMLLIFIVYGASFAVQALVRPVYGIALVLFYYDQRIRQEGFDIEWMMQQAGMLPAPKIEPQAAPALPAAPVEPSAPVLEPPQAEDRIGQGPLPGFEAGP
jgi:hypothetical protein